MKPSLYLQLHNYYSIWTSTKTICGQFSDDASTTMLKCRIYSTNCLEDQTKVSKTKP
jgi:hypothetical protein